MAYEKKPSRKVFSVNVNTKTRLVTIQGYDEAQIEAKYLWGEEPEELTNEPILEFSFPCAGGEGGGKYLHAVLKLKEDERLMPSDVQKMVGKTYYLSENFLDSDGTKKKRK